ncbi:MAG: hypothetical protein ACYCXT_00100 [Acidiferrobacteraceae bacterium]
MNLEKTLSPHLSGRLARYVQEITGARARGVSWRQILQEVGPAIGLDPAGNQAEVKLRQAFYRARSQVEKGKLAGQLPLPAPATRQRITNPAEVRQARRVEINPDDYQE